MELIYEHYVETARLAQGGWILDVGSRHGEFASHFAARGFTVLAVDPSPDLSQMNFSDVIFENVAVVPSQFVGMTDYIICRSNTEANHIAGVGVDAPGDVEGDIYTIKVPAVTVDQLMQKYDIPQFELAKFDCEGSESLLLECGAIAKQISIEFHLHVGQTQEQAQAIIDHLKSLGYKQRNDDYASMLFMLE